MNLHGIASPYIGSVNPLIPVSVRISEGYATAADGTRVPAYATPSALTASISAGILTVASISAGVLMPSQTISGAGVLANTQIVAQLTGADGGPGTYRLNRVYESPVVSVAMTAALVLMAQVQPLTWRDLQQIEGLTMNGTRRKIYLYGTIDAVVRSLRKGGDLIAIDSGVNAGEWLVAQVIEQFPDWASAAITLQNQQP